VTPRESIGWLQNAKTRQGILRVLAGYPYKPYRGLGLGTEEMLAHAFLAGLAGSRLVVARGRRRIRGLAFYQDLPWESRLFGVRMAKIDAIVADSPDIASYLVGTVVGNCRSEGIRHLSARTEFSDLLTARALERTGFYLADTLVTLHRTDKTSPEAENDKLEAYSPRYRRDLREIARRSLGTNRFSTDPHLDQRAARKMYSLWLENGIDGRADFARVSIAGDRPSGFVLCRKLVEEMPGSQLVIGTLDLIAVAPEHQGQGLGKRLVRAACQWLSANSAIHFVRTRGDNFVALGAYTSVGFRFYSGKMGFHLWLGD
jgi:dTDP-4-amino-4,6-dideoxy-D-galactose acyltransferase